MQSIIETLDCGHYTFTLERDMDLALDIQRITVWATERAEGQGISEKVALRHFYFEEGNRHHIRNFCRKFALNESYQREVISQETRWAKRNALFVRNLSSVTAPLPGGDPMEKRHVIRREREHEARKLFRWLDTHVEEILALPEYQYLQALDSAFELTSGPGDPHIRPAIEALNSIAGAATHCSCQGVSGKVEYEGCELLVVSPHEEFAYVSFMMLGLVPYQSIIALLPEFPSITYVDQPGKFAVRHVLCSTGDNLLFRKELAELASFVLRSVGTGSSRQVVLEQ